MESKKTRKNADELAREVLTLSRNTLLVNLRFLDAALSQFSLESRPGITLATDGQTLYYDAVHVLRSYRGEHAVPARDYLHLVLHCVLRHMFPRRRVDPDVWDLACDMAVEHAISELGLTAVCAEREKKQQAVLEDLKKELGMLTAEKIYRTLRAKQLPPSQLEELRVIFLADEHQSWHTREENGPWGQPPEAAKTAWVDISQRMQVDMETFARKQGARAEALMQNLREVNRETYDYAGFLQKFAARGEALRTDPEEFDYIFYTYGMRLYENMPLIEPLEYKEVKRLREFVLAVDLSGLLSLEQAKRFLRKIWEVLQATEHFALKINLHILTCRGTTAPEYAKITRQAEFDAYLDGLKIRRPGDADFRPAFLLVDEMVGKRAFHNLKGMLYFTDGMGAFPAKKPGYDAAFIFVNDNYSSPDVPPWAIRLVLQKGELSEDES